MILGSLTDLEIFVARVNAIGGFNQLKAKAAQIEDADWQMFYAGAMCMFNIGLNKQLKRFGVEVNDGKTD